MNNMPMYIGTICAFSFDFAPVGWVACEGQRVQKNQAINLFNVIGYQYGGSGDFFYLPDLRGRAVIERGQASPVSPDYQIGQVGGVETVTLNEATMPAHNHGIGFTFNANNTRTDIVTPVGNYPSMEAAGTNVYNSQSSTGDFLASSTITINPAGVAPSPMSVLKPYLVTKYCICIDGPFPTPTPSSIDQPPLGTVQAFAFNAIPNDWRECNGQTLDPNAYMYPFSMIGTTYGGDGIYSFGLPDLRGREAIGFGQAPGMSNYYLGQTGGNEQVTLSQANLVPHSHDGSGTMPSATATETSSPGNQYPAVSDLGNGVYSKTQNGAMTGGSITTGSTGGSQPINVLNPYTVMVYCIYVGDPM